MRAKKTTDQIEITLWRTIIVSFVLGFSIFLLFSPALRYGLISLDDSDYVGEHRPHSQEGLTWEGMRWALTTTHAANWHPVTWLSHMLDVEIFGSNVSGKHFTSIFFHTLNAVLVFLTLQQMTKALWRSAFVAALFAFHPLHVESVVWISERKDVLSTFFFILTILAYSRYAALIDSPHQKQSSAHLRKATLGGKIRSWKIFYGLALIFFALGLMSKPMVVTLPFVLLLLDVWPLQRIAFVISRHPMEAQFRSSRRFGALLLEKTPFFALTIASCIITFIAQKHAGAVHSVIETSIQTRIGNAFISYVRYIGKMFWPTDLAIFYPYSNHLPAWQVISAALILAAVSAVAIWLARRHPYFLFGWLWFLGTLMPVIGVIQVGSQSIADRYTYIPLVGLFIASVWAIADIWSRTHLPKAVLFLAGGMIVLSCIVTTKKQIGHWQDNETLFTHAINVTKGNYIAYNHLGITLSEKKRYPEAIAAYQKSIEFNPDFSDAHNNLGITLSRVGNIDQAIGHYFMALNSNSNNANAHNNLATALAAKGDFETAIHHLRAACKLKPDFIPAANGLAWILATHPDQKFRSGTEAIDLALHAADLTGRQNADILQTLAAAHAETGNFSDAIKAANEGIALAKKSGDKITEAQLAHELILYKSNRPFRDASLLK